MTTAQLDKYFRSFLDIDRIALNDISLNGLQVDNDGADITKIAFAVDARLESFKRAAAIGAGMLFVHHGLFLGKPLALTGGHRQRIKQLLDSNIALYACHLPLDVHPELGNNAGLARLLGMTELKPFGIFRGLSVGFSGVLKEPLTTEEALRRISFKGSKPLGVYPCGKEVNKTCALISGGGADDVQDAIAMGFDLYVTGDMKHEVYSLVEEAGINMIAGGHYNTEVWGVRSVMEKCVNELGLDAEFIDLPTGL
jgi:dinuclear metal center YbgI/SA1388 family protein